jgi:hypothetical protein
MLPPRSVVPPARPAANQGSGQTQPAADPGRQRGTAHDPIEHQAQQPDEGRSDGLDQQGQHLDIVEQFEHQPLPIPRA